MGKQREPLKPSILIVILAAFFLVGGVHLFLPNPDPSDTDTVIASASACENHRLLSDIYERLLETDPLNLEYHRGFIANRSEEFHIDDKEPERSVEALRKRYQDLTGDADQAHSDIGHYGLGFLALQEDDYSAAMQHLLRVRNRSLLYLNNSLGYTHFKRKEYGQAEKHFRKEIRLEGHLGGAYANLGRLFLETREYEELGKLVDEPGAAGRLGGGCLRINHLVQGEYWQYAKYAVMVGRITFPGLICACLILAAWFFYLRRLDVFEPERYRDLLLVLAMGMVFSELATPLYDFFRVYLGLFVNGSKGNDLVFCIFGIGLIEEAVKIVPVLIMLKWSKAINESVDFVIYASVSALGFAFMENLLYFRHDGLTAVSGRAFTAVLAHMSLSSIVVYGLFCARYSGERRGWKTWLRIGAWFFAACLLHGLYDFFLIAENMGYWRLMSPLIFLFVVDQFGRIINTALNHSEFAPQEKKALVDNTDYLIYVLSGIVMLEYLTLALLFGPVNATASFPAPRMVVMYIALGIIASHLGCIQIRPKRWTPFFGRRVPKESESVKPAR